MSCPKAVASEVKVLDLINSENGSDLEQSMVVFDDPAVVTDGDHNTSVVVNSTAVSPYGGKVEVQYDRLDLNVLFHGLAVEMAVSGTPTLADKICGINAEYGTDLDVEDFIEEPMDENYTKIKALATSLAYTGEIVCRFYQMRLPLDERLTTNQLAGFKYPNADTPTLNNPVFTRNVVLSQPEQWYFGPPDNGMGYDQTTNGELTVGLRGFSVTPGWNAVRGRVGKEYLSEEQGRVLTSWRQANGNTRQATTYEQPIYFGMVGKTQKEVLDEYAITVTLTSRPNPTGAVKTGVYRVEYLEADNAIGFVKVSGDGAVRPNMIGGPNNVIPLIVTMNGTPSYFPGLTENRQVVGGANVFWYTGVATTSIRAVRKKGGAKDVILESKFTAT